MKTTTQALQEQDGQLAVSIIKDWKSDPKVRAEFGGNLNTYSAYRRGTASGAVRTCGSSGRIG